MITAVELTTRLGELSLPSPVMTAAGCGGSGADLGRFTDLTALGAFVTRTMTLDPRVGNAGRRLAETPSGVLTDIGYENEGLHAFLAVELPPLTQVGVRTVVSITGRSLGEYGELARRAGGAPGVVALEVTFGDEDPYAAGKCLAVVRRDAPRGVAVLAKLTPSGAFLDVARELVKNGADALVVGHPPRGLAIDPATLAPSVRGGLSGPAIGPLVLDAVWRVFEAMPETPVVGVGGVRSGSDALALIAAGASAVQVGAATLRDPSAPGRVQAELAAALAERTLTVADVVGIAHRGGL